MIYCPQCGTANSSGQFCSHCGKPLPTQNLAQQPLQPQQPPQAWQLPQPQQPPQPWQQPQQQGFQQQAPGVMPGQPQPSWQGYAAPPKRSGATVWLVVGGLLLLLLVGGGFMLLGGGGAGAPAAGGSSSSAQDSGMGFEFNVSYGLAVPGAAYTQSAGGDKVRYVLSTGVKTKSVVTIKPDGTYVWDSAWDGKVIKGNWEKTGDAGYPIRLLKAQEGKNWGLGADTRPGAKPGAILLVDGSIYYEGFPLK